MTSPQPAAPAARPASGRRDREGVLRRASRAAFSVQALGLATSFGLQWLLARTLKADGYGLFVYSLTWISVLALVATLGLQRVALRFVPAYQVTGDWNLLRGFLLRSRQLVFLTAALLALAAAVVVHWRWAELPPGLAPVLAIAAAALPLTALLEVQVDVLRGFHRILLPLGARDVVRPALTALAVLALLGLGIDLTARWAMAIHVGSLSVAVALTSVAVGLASPALARNAEAEHETSEWLRVGLPLLLVAGSHLLLKQMDTLMIGMLLGPTQAGIYAVAVRVVLPISFGLKAVNTIMAPLIAQLHAEGDRNGLQRVTTLAAQRIFVFTVAAAAIAIVFAEPILAFFGGEFVAGATALRLLAASHLVNALAGSVGLLLAMTGHQLDAAVLVGGGVGVNLVLNLALIPLWGIEGAAVATTVAMVGWNAAAVIRVKQRLGISALVRRLS